MPRPTKKRVKGLHLDLVGIAKRFRLDGFRYEVEIDGAPYTVYLVPSDKVQLEEVRIVTESES